jgi:hypothetical protein
MKTKIKLFSLILILSVGIWITPQKASAQRVVSFQVFYDDLSPYGTWVDTPYGYVWSPDVAPGFTPYATNGYWAFTDEGWTWISNYPWGWAPFHYGRWYTDAIYGPLWIPDTQWGPGWVDWRRQGDYYGWEPMGPYGYNFYAPHNRWTYANGHDFGKHNNKNYHYMNSSFNGMVPYKTKPINNFRYDKNNKIKYNAGPRKNEIEKYSGKKITPYTIKESGMPGQKLSKNQVQLYKPQVQKNGYAGKKDAPYKATGLKDFKPSAQKNYKAPTQKSNQVTNKPNQSQPKQSVQPKKQQQTQSKQSVQTNNLKQPQSRQSIQPTIQKQSQYKQSVKPSLQKQTQSKQSMQPSMQIQTQSKQSYQPTKQQQSQPKQSNPSKKGK